MKSPFPWFGGKSKVSDIVWDYFGDVANYVEPFFGSGAVLLNRPTTPGIETINDLDCLVANFWRALQNEPDEVARYGPARRLKTSDTRAATTQPRKFRHR